MNAVGRVDSASPPFALARLRDGADTRLAVVVGEQVRALAPDELGAADLHAFLAAGDWSAVARAAAAPDGWRPRSEVVLTAPVTPRQVLQAGANYRTHVIELIMAGLGSDGEDFDPVEARARAEQTMDARAASGRPFLFIGLSTCVVGDDEPLRLPSGSEQHDWEMELAVVIGKPAYRVDRDSALEHVAGYTMSNDISTRDLLFSKDSGALGADWFRAKNAPGFLPTGPLLVPAQFVEPSELRVQLELNGELMQDAPTAELIYDVPALVAAASQTTTLLPGDLLLTGSPAGNGQHWRRFLRPGDVMTGRITGLGEQVVRCIAGD